MGLSDSCYINMYPFVDTVFNYFIINCNIFYYILYNRITCSFISYSLKLLKNSYTDCDDDIILFDV